jgi:hypothetical protein
VDEETTHYFCSDHCAERFDAAEASGGPVPGPASDDAAGAHH